MVHITVAIAKFVEALFWGIFQAAGLALVGMAIALSALWLGWRHVRRRKGS